MTYTITLDLKGGNCPADDVCISCGEYFDCMELMAEGDGADCTLCPKCIYKKKDIKD